MKSLHTTVRNNPLKKADASLFNPSPYKYRLIKTEIILMPAEIRLFLVEFFDSIQPLNF
jgi:hypothetical protein